MSGCNISAIVLSGGRGTRMNGMDKAWIDYQGKPLIHHVIDNINRHVEHIIISYNRSEEKYEQLPYQGVRDLTPDFRGPLLGVLSCLPYITSEYTLIVPCDTPHLPDDLAQRLLNDISFHKIAICCDEQRIHPLVMLARTSVLASIKSYLDRGKRSVIGWCEQADPGYVRVKWEDAGVFKNVNKINELDD